jgi:hypothetical protein
MLLWKITDEFEAYIYYIIHLSIVCFILNFELWMLYLLGRKRLFFFLKIQITFFNSGKYSLAKYIIAF